MGKELVKLDKNMPAEISSGAIPAIVLATGEKGAYRFLKFFAADIRNRNTRMAYYRAACTFFEWCRRKRVTHLADIGTHHVAAYIEHLGQVRSRPTVKQHLAAIRMLFNWLVMGQIVPTNPATVVRGPRYVVKKGKTPVLLGEEARQLLDSMTTETVVGLRDRAFIALLIYTFARVSAATAMNVEDVYVQGRRTWVRLHEKGGKEHTLPCHHELEAYLDDYITTAGMAGAKGTPLFRTAIGKTKRLSDRRLHRVEAYQMIKRRAVGAGIKSPVSCHTFRATGITQYLLNNGTLEKAQLMAAHESPRTTKLYDRTQDEVTLDEVERIMLG